GVHFRVFPVDFLGFLAYLGLSLFDVTLFQAQHVEFLIELILALFKALLRLPQFGAGRPGLFLEFLLSAEKLGFGVHFGLLDDLLSALLGALNDPGGFAFGVGATTLVDELLDQVAAAGADAEREEWKQHIHGTFREY